MYYTVVRALRFTVGMPLAVLGGAACFVWWALAVGWHAAAQRLGDPD